MRWLTRAAEMGSAAAACQLVQILEQKDPLAPPAAHIAALLETCASQGDPRAQAMLGLWYLQGKHCTPNADRAVGWFELAARGGDAFAQAWLGDALVGGKFVKADPATAALWYERAALQGHAGATQSLTALRVAAGASPTAMASLFKLWLNGAKRGDAVAQRIVGDFYMRGVGVKRSLDEARRWLAAAARQGNTPAMVLLGGLLLQSDESDKYREAVELFRRAAAQRNTDAVYNLGVCLRRGLGVTADPAAAERFYRSAAKRKHASAQLALGDLIVERAASDAAWSEALRWYRMAADGGHETAKARIAQLQAQRS
jgi:TPR repeat protein